MVGQTTQRPNPKDITELAAEIRSKKIDARQKIVDMKKMITEIERDLAAAEAEENLLDSILFSIEHMGESTSTKKRNTRKGSRKNDSEEEDEEEIDENEEGED